MCVYVLERPISAAQRSSVCPARRASTERIEIESAIAAAAAAIPITAAAPAQRRCLAMVMLVAAGGYTVCRRVDGELSL